MASNTDKFRDEAIDLIIQQSKTKQNNVKCNSKAIYFDYLTK